MGAVLVSQLGTALLVPLLCWWVSSSASVGDGVGELEVLNVEAWGGHLTLAMALDVHPGPRMTPFLDAARPYAFPILLLAMVGTLAASILLTGALLKLAATLLVPEGDSAAVAHLGQVTSSVVRTQQLLSERQMELAALQSKAQHLEEEIRRAALDVERRQLEFRSVEERQAQLAGSLPGSLAASPSHVPSRAVGGTPPSTSLMAATSPATSGARRRTSRSAGSEAGTRLLLDDAACDQPAYAQPPSEAGFDKPVNIPPPKASLFLTAPASAPRVGGGVGASTSLAELELSSPEIGQFARLLGLSCGGSRAYSASAVRAVPSWSERHDGM
ncbi:hypothetical protein T492DRAFT_1005605 [Pavlovales sp. CCMP2436]|nr:hypothetical protein T492DRAFT_1005605 [Pavlovales sp. CCMP2436]|mmetsp:Transcript_32886/g.81745  ORF Transcript_32886/g.81745 Transcript_32886/m.81745 type:complete len:330 (+) Transcript_32886:88-1077(+)